MSAAASHTAVVWIVALAGLHFGARLDNERTEAYFQLTSAVLIIAIARWMIDRTWREQREHARHSAHGHDRDDHHHDHDDGHVHAPREDMSEEDYQDIREREYAAAIERRFAGQRPNTGQIVLFGLTGGLVPCPASITVLLLCLQLKKYSLGLTLVLGFSIGLALTMVATGALAALSVRAASERLTAFKGFGVWARRAPYFSSPLIIGIGIYTANLGWNAL